MIQHEQSQIEAKCQSFCISCCQVSSEVVYNGWNAVGGPGCQKQGVSIDDQEPCRKEIVKIKKDQEIIKKSWGITESLR